jgi:hypothetical protein
VKVKAQFDAAPEKERRMKYSTNTNYVYEPFGWETK